MSGVLVATAHPDDESLWAGGYLAAHPGTHVACCCIDRRKLCRLEWFYEACKTLDAVPFVLAGEFRLHGLDTRPVFAFAQRYQTIITHNHIGEYGHKAHIKLHEAMVATGKRVYGFNYGIEPGEPIDYERKREAIQCYQNPKILQGRSREFDLTRESLISYCS